jgi:tetratricopeptide (TPR) repeat protein
MARRLEEAYLMGAAVKDDHFDSEAVGAAIAAAFAWYGLDVDRLGTAETGERLRARTIPLHLAAALDQLAELRYSQTDKRGHHMLAAARAVDPDPWRNRLRAAIEARDEDGLEALGASADARQLSPASAVLFARFVKSKTAVERAVVLLEGVQQRHPANFWVNHELGWCLAKKVVPRRLGEAFRYYSVAVALRPQSPGARVNLAWVLCEKGLHDRAILESQEAIRLKNDYTGAHVNLGHALCASGRVDEAVAELREAIRLNPDDADAHSILGGALGARDRLEEAVAECREAIRIKPNSPEAHINLGQALWRQGRVDEAAAEQREAIRLNPNSAMARGNLAVALSRMGQPDEAVALFKESIRLKPDFAPVHTNFGIVLREMGRLGEAAAEQREAIRIQENYPEAHCELGVVLQAQGFLLDGLAELKRGHELGPGQPSNRRRSAELVRRAELLVNFDARLPSLLRGDSQPADAGECLALGEFCLETKKLYAPSARWYSQAFAAEPKLAERPHTHRYNAVCAAALAGCGQGADADKVDDAERTRLRRQALDWLTADLADLTKIADKLDARPYVRKVMQHWQADTDLAGVRDATALAKLPAAERADWQKIWADVATQLKALGDPEANQALPAKP